MLKHGSNIFFSTNLNKSVTIISFRRSEAKNCASKMFKKNLYTVHWLGEATKRTILNLVPPFFSGTYKFMWHNLCTEDSVMKCNVAALVLAHWLFSDKNIMNGY